MVANDEKPVPQPIETQKTENLFSETEKEFALDMENIVKERMSEHPAAANFVTDRMSRALTVPERASVARTSLVVYKEMVENPPEKVQGDQYSLSLKEDIEVEEMDNLYYRRKEGDSNIVYTWVAEYIGKDRPDLARYIAGCMHESVSPDSAALVGETALVLHNSMKSYMQHFS
ncbi:hypothetical protein ACFL13_01890 [Patescibacteria group bacterium]